MLDDVAEDDDVVVDAKVLVGPSGEVQQMELVDPVPDGAGATRAVGCTADNTNPPGRPTSEQA